MNRFNTYEKAANDDHCNEVYNTSGVAYQHTVPKWFNPFAAQCTEHNHEWVEIVGEIPTGHFAFVKSASIFYSASNESGKTKEAWEKKEIVAISEMTSIRCLTGVRRRTADGGRSTTYLCNLRWMYGIQVSWICKQSWPEGYFVREAFDRSCSDASISLRIRAPLYPIAMVAAVEND